MTHINIFFFLGKINKSFLSTKYANMDYIHAHMASKQNALQNTFL